MGSRADFRVRTAFGEVEIELRPLARVDRAAQEASLRELARLAYDFKYRAPEARRAVLSILSSLNGAPVCYAGGHQPDFDAGSPLADEIVRRLESAVRAGCLVLRRKVGRSVVVPLQGDVEDCLGPEPEPTAWIAIELVDDLGNPVTGAPYRIECADGRVRTGATNAYGKAREEGLHDGVCKVKFPRLHAPDWAEVG
jgi:hypothetical protein